MKMFIIFGLLLSCSAEADEWDCTQSALHKSYPDVIACGVGSGKTEEIARSEAWSNAKGEFTKFCDLDDSCHGHSILVEPRRSACDVLQDGTYKCLRQIVFILQKEMRDRPITSGDKFESYSYEEGQPKLKVGLTKRELLETFGKPSTVTKRDDALRLTFDNKMCLYNAAHLDCVVMLEDDKVVSWDKIKPEYTEDLK